MVQPTREYISSYANPKHLIPIFLIIGIFGVLLNYRLNNPYTLLYPIALIAGALSYTILSRDHSTSFSKFERWNKPTVIISFIIISVIVIRYINLDYSRDFTVFLLTVLLYGIVALYVVACASPGRGLFLISVSATVNRATIFYTSSLFTGMDIYSHVSLTSNLIREGTTSAMKSKYAFAPLYHIYTGSSQLIFDLPIKHTVFIVISVVITITGILSLYSIANQFWGTRVGLVAALLYVSSDFVIRWGVDPIPTSMGLALFSVVILLLVKYTFVRNWRYYAIMSSIIVAIALTHQVSLFITVVASIGFIIPLAVYDRDLELLAVVGFLSILIQYIEFTLARFGGVGGSTVFFDRVAPSIILSIIRSGGRSAPNLVPPGYSQPGSAGLTLIHVLGSAILLSFAVFGSLLWLNSTSQNRHKYGLCLGCVVTIMLSIALAGPLIGLRKLLPWRWFAFIYSILSILAAPALVSIGSSIPSLKKRKSIGSVLLIILILVPYFALMGGTFMGSPDNPIFHEAPIAERFSVQESERALFLHTAMYESEKTTVLGDLRAAQILVRHYSIQANTILIDYGNPNSIQGPAIVVDRAYLRTSHALYIVNYHEREVLVVGKFNTAELESSVIYDSGPEKLRLVS